MLRVRRLATYCEPSYRDPPASERVSVVRESEASTCRSPAGAFRSSQADRRNGREQSDLGRGTDRRRTLVKDRHSDLPADSPALYANRTETSRNDFPMLDDVRAESCESDHRV